MYEKLIYKNTVYTDRLIKIFENGVYRGQLIKVYVEAPNDHLMSRKLLHTLPDRCK